MTLPNFLIVGAQKSGTTSLHDILSEHPEANMSTIKEVNYFTNPKKYDKGLKYYASYFENQNSLQKITGESSPGYMCYPNMAERIHNDLGEIKIVMILRDPIKRAFSQYWDNRRHLSEFLTEGQIIDEYLSELYLPGERGYFSRGIYIKFIENYLNYFKKENIHIIIFEDLISNQTKELKRLYEFLGIDSNKGLQELPKASNSSMIWKNYLYEYLLENPEITKYIPKRMRRLFFFGKKRNFKYQLPEGEELVKLKGFYKPWNAQLKNFLNKDLEFWL